MDNTDTNQSLSHQRRDRSRKSGKRSGILLFLFLFICVAGIAWYWFGVFVPQRDSEGYEEETQRIIADLKAKGGQLSEGSSREAVEAYESEVQALAKREGVELTIVDPLLANVEGFKNGVVVRTEAFEELLEAVKTFPLDSTREEIRAFDNRVSSAVNEFERMLGGKLQYEWLQRRKEVVSHMRQQPVGELTIRSDPSKAEVYMDGELLAKTPFKVSQVKAGTREIVLKKEGYRDKRISTMIKGSAVNDLGVQVLEPIVGSVDITVTGGRSRDKVEVEIEEISESVLVGSLEVVQGYQHLEGREHSLEKLKIGEYALIVLVNGKVAKQSTFVVKESETLQVSVEL